ncbi:hypothetical protein AD006_29340 (plasmid) [Pseudonocardia sp. EC080610-09]|nr:hypothetical protein AD006_29340 [Pseudonocardia sp. EC080610-09]ALL85806.1 hypothetical protein AD017_31915 [Pseudonocardia sp. EC080619-01]
MPEFLRQRPDHECGEARQPAVVRVEGEHAPGEPGLWVFLLGDMTLFGVFFVVFLAMGRDQHATFAASREDLNQTIGGVNTLVLLTSSLLVVLALAVARAGHQRRAARLVAGAGGCAALFTILKMVEYTAEVSAGNTPGVGLFFTFYFILTGIHLLHVLVGSVLLFVLWRRLRMGAVGHRGLPFAEGAACYWHMVDLLWIVLFPLLYLGFSS